MTVLIIIIILAVLALVLSCCKVSADNDPCKHCKAHYCHDCDYWKEMTGDADC